MTKVKRRPDPFCHIASEQKVPTVPAQLHLPTEQLISCLSYSAFKLLADIEQSKGVKSKAPVKAGKE